MKRLTINMRDPLYEVIKDIAKTMDMKPTSLVNAMLEQAFGGEQLKILKAQNEGMKAFKKSLEESNKNDRAIQ